MKKALLLLMIAAMAACGKNEEELAMENYEKIDSAYQANDYEKAKAYIDTLNTKYPKQVSIRKKAKIIDLNIKISEQKKNLAFADSMFKIKEEDFNNSLGGFNFEKNEKYQTEGNYTVKGQETARIENRTMLKPYITERGELQIHSQATGATGHTKITVSCGEQKAESEEVRKGSAYNNIYTAGEISHQTVVIREAADNIASLVEENANGNIKVTQSGENGRTMTSYTLSQQDKNAIIKAYGLSKKLRELMEFKHQREVAEKKIAVYTNSLADYEAEENMNKNKENEETK